ncbi:unnamed protein product, partial [Polarella glacialis]
VTMLRRDADNTRVSNIVVATPRQILELLDTPLTAPAWDTAIRWLDMVVVDEADRLVAKWNKIQQRHRAWEGKVDPCMQLLKLIDEATEKSQRADCWQLVAASATMNRTTHRNLKFSSGIDIASVRAGGSALPEAGGGGQTGDGTSSWPSALRHMVTVARPYQFPKVMSVAAVTIGKLAADRLLVVLATTSDAGRAPSSIYSLNIVVAQLRLRLAEFGTFEVVTVAAAVEAAAALWTVEGSAQRKRRASGSREVVVADAQAVRGIHLDNIDAVVIIGDPISVGEYLHCAGRTCRFQPGHAEPTGGTVVSVVASNVADRMEQWAALSGFTLLEVKETGPVPGELPKPLPTKSNKLPSDRASQMLQLELEPREASGAKVAPRQAAPLKPAARE